MTVLTLDEALESRTQQVDDARERELGWGARLVAARPDATAAAIGVRGATGLALSALYGLSLGVRHGGAELVVHALGVPLGLLAAAVVGGPTMFVFLSMCRAPIDGRALANTASRGLASAGVLLAGLAPATALFVVSSETPEAATFAVLAGLLLGGGVALARTAFDVLRAAARGPSAAVLGGTGVAIAFTVIAVALAVRVWQAVLPILGGAS